MALRAPTRPQQSALVGRSAVSHVHAPLRTTRANSTLAPLAKRCSGARERTARSPAKNRHCMHDRAIGEHHRGGGCNSHLGLNDVSKVDGEILRCCFSLLTMKQHESERYIRAAPLGVCDGCASQALSKHSFCSMCVTSIIMKVFFFFFDELVQT